MSATRTTGDLWWSHQYGRHWLHLCIADVLSSPSQFLDQWLPYKYSARAEPCDLVHMKLLKSSQPRNKLYGSIQPIVTPNLPFI
jgi:hypothetical protein